MSNEFDVKDLVPLDRYGDVVDGKFVPVFNVICPERQNGRCLAYSTIQQLQTKIMELERKLKSSGKS